MAEFFISLVTINLLRKVVSQLVRQTDRQTDRYSSVLQLMDNIQQTCNVMNYRFF